MADPTALEHWTDPRGMATLGATSALVVSFTTAFSQVFPTLPPIQLALLFSTMLAYGQVFYLSPIEGAGRKLFFAILTSAMIFAAARGGNATAASVEQAIRTAPEVTWSLIPEASASPWPTEVVVVTTNQPPPVFKPW